MDEKRNYVKKYIYIYIYVYTVALYLGVLKLILAIFDVPQTTETKLLFCRAF